MQRDVYYFVNCKEWLLNVKQWTCSQVINLNKTLRNRIHHGKIGKLENLAE